MMEEATGWIQDTYRDNYVRLPSIKVTYDLGNLFRVNQKLALKV